MRLLDYFKMNPEQWIPRQDVADFLNVNKRQTQDFVGELNDWLSVEGSRFFVCSSTGKPSGYCYTDCPEITARSMRQIKKHALSELRKYRPAKIALQRQREFLLKKQPEPVVESNLQMRLL